jgi:signal transduction histidine kinase
VSAISLVSWLWRPAWRLREIGWGDIALAAILSLWAVGLVSGVVVTRPHSGVAAAIVVLAMTIPVVWERRAPLGAAAALAVGAALNELLIGPMVRCGPGLPAVFVIAFFAATRLDRRRLAVAAALCLAAVALQSFYDPNLGASFLVAGVPVVLASCLAGRLARSRARAAAALRERNAELRQQREQTAELAVAADRARVAGDLDKFLRDRITAMADAAAAGRELLTEDPAAAQAAFAAVENSGRATLGQMREVVGTLREERLTGRPGAVGLPDRRAPAGDPAGRAGRAHQRAGTVRPRRARAGRGRADRPPRGPGGGVLGRPREGRPAGRDAADRQQPGRLGRAGQAAAGGRLCPFLSALRGSPAAAGPTC